MRKKNNYEVNGSVAKVFFLNKEGYFLCDTKDLHYLIDSHNWYADKDGYARTYIDGKTIFAHTYLLGKQDGKEIDHINRIRYDNRRENLRFVSHVENMRNTNVLTRYNVGVYLRKGRYISSIHVGNKTIHLGCFDTEEEAIRTRKEAEVFYWGKQA